MAKRKIVEDESDEVESPGEPERETHDPNQFVSLDGSYVELDNSSRERRIAYGGSNYEHVSDDPDGVWEYRRM